VLRAGGYTVSVWLNMAAVYANCHSYVECTTVTALCCQVKGDHNCVKETAQLSRGWAQVALINSIYFSISTCWRWSSVQKISRTRGNAISIKCSVFNEQDQRTVSNGHVIMNNAHASYRRMDRHNSVEQSKTWWVMSHTQDSVHDNLETLYQLFKFV